MGIFGPKVPDVRANLKNMKKPFAQLISVSSQKSTKNPQNKLRVWFGVIFGPKIPDFRKTKKPAILGLSFGRLSTRTEFSMAETRQKTQKMGVIFGQKSEEKRPPQGGQIAVRSDI